MRGGGEGDVIEENIGWRGRREKIINGDKGGEEGRAEREGEVTLKEERER